MYLETRLALVPILLVHVPSVRVIVLCILSGDDFCIYRLPPRVDKYFRLVSALLGRFAPGWSRRVDFLSPFRNSSSLYWLPLRRARVIHIERVSFALVFINAAWKPDKRLQRWMRQR